MHCSDETAADVDNEVMKLLKESYKEAKKLLKENRKLLDKLAAFLIKRETITGAEFMKIYCREKGIPVPEKKSYEERFKEAKRDSSDEEDTTPPEEKPEQKELSLRQDRADNTGNNGYSPQNDWQARNNAPQNHMPGQQIDFTIDDSLIPDRNAAGKTDRLPDKEAGATDNGGGNGSDAGGTDGDSSGIPV